MKRIIHNYDHYSLEWHHGVLSIYRVDQMVFRDSGKAQFLRSQKEKTILFLKLQMKVCSSTPRARGRRELPCTVQTAFRKQFDPDRRPKFFTQRLSQPFHFILRGSRLDGVFLS